MPRNGSGTYTLPTSAFVSGSVIKSSAMNTVLSDIASALTGSLATNGEAVMTGQLKADNGSLASPSYSFNADQDTGFYLSGTNEVTLVVGGSALAAFKSDLSVEWEGPHVFSGGITFSATVSYSATFSISNTLSVGGTATFSSSVAFDDTVSFEATVSFSATITIGGDLYLPSGYIELTEISEPASAAANSIRLYVRDRVDVSRLVWMDENGQNYEPGLVLLDSGSVSSAATLDITLTQYSAFSDLLTSPFSSIQIKLTELETSVSGDEFLMRCSDDGGATYETSAYSYANLVAHSSMTSSSSLIATGSGSDSSIMLIFNCDTSVYAAVDLTISSRFVLGEAIYQLSTGDLLATDYSGGKKGTTGNINAVRFFFSTGNIVHAKYHIYGLA